MIRNLIVTLLFVLPLITHAQKKTFTFDEIFRGRYPGIFNQLPEIEGWADDNHYIVVREDGEGNGNRYSVNVASGKESPYVPAKEKENMVPEVKDAMNITLSPDGKYAAYTKKGNLYLMDVASNAETALTQDGGGVILNGYASWIYYEEILGRASNYKAFWWSPDSKHIAFMRFDEEDVPLFPIYFADGQYGHLEQGRYPKAGDENPEVKIGIVDIGGKKTTWADFDEKRDQYFGTPIWMPSNELLVLWMNRGQDTLDVFKVNHTTGSKNLFYHEAQPTWISLDEEARFTFLSVGKGFILKSDKDGWHNLYLHDDKGKELNRITSGKFWDTEILFVDEKNAEVYLRARKDNSARFDLYKASLKGNKITRLSSGDSSYDMASVSPNGKHIVAMYSNLGTPPVVVALNNQGKVLRTIANMRTAASDSYAMPMSKLMSVKSDDAKFDLPMTITYPVDFDSTKKYPVWISVYGGPNAGTVYDRWKHAGGTHQWWAQEGVIQVSMDNRSSGHFGKLGMNYIFKQLGKYEIEDYMACAKYLKSLRYVDASKIGITGGSFGGYITCMALTYGSDVFTHGIANYSVTDWKLYDTHYTERFMKTPAQNPEGYKKTSVLSYVNRYKGILRLVHGSTDDNVHMQNSIQLIDLLQNQNKLFELMIYPNQRHGIGNNKARHNFVETCRFIYKYLLEKDLPKDFVQ